ncbi:MAG: metG [Betaproteobacteria bacterium]|nr:metG [Betaproteobacteria bacterium]
MSRTLFVTTALPYANGPFHIGHIMEYIQADIWVRFQRMRGNTVHFVGADDAHGAPIMIAAEKAGKTPQEFVAEIAGGRKQYLDGFHISFDNWHSTDSPENTELSQDIYRKLKAKGLIATKTIEQFYDPVKGMFLPDRYIKGECPVCHSQDQYGDACEVCSSVYAPTELISPYSTLTGAAPVMKSSEHYFFKLSDPQCVDFLKSWTGGERLQSQVANKAREWLEGDSGLADWDISRDEPYFGIPIPDAPGKYFYVWLDAPVGYLASLKNYCARAGIDFAALLKDPETEQIHFIGKDIIYFHTLFWPAMLKFADYKVPDRVYVHGFMTVKSEKMSKSRGTGISPLKYLAIGMNAEWLRYYIAAKLNSNVEDVDFIPDDFIARVNSDLIGKYVNIASRCAGFVTKKFGGKLDAPQFSPEITAAYSGAAAEIAAFYETREYGKAARKIMELADLANQYVDANKPWELAKQAGQEAQLHAVCSTALALFRELTLYLKPILPHLAEQAEKLLNVAPMAWSDAWKPLAAGHQINAYTHLMARVDPKLLDTLLPPEEAAEPAPAKAVAKAAAKPATKAEAKPADAAGAGLISIDDFAKVDLRIARIVNAEHVEGAEKLIKITLDVGEEKPRTVFAGIKSAYDPGTLIGKHTVMVANLAPRKMKFGLSEGMILAASDPAGKHPGLFILQPHQGALPGMKVK